jgi:hypothetical protein
VRHLELLIEFVGAEQPQIALLRKLGPDQFRPEILVAGAGWTQFGRGTGGAASGTSTALPLSSGLVTPGGSSSKLGRDCVVLLLNVVEFVRKAPN